MKRIVMAASALAALGIAGGASAHDATKAFTVDGFARKECHIHAPTTTVHIGNIINHDGFLNTSINSTIATKLSALGVTAWCNGNSNAVNLYRTALVNQVHNGTGGPGTQDANTFDTAAIYDIDVNIAGATRSDGSTELEGTSDGIGNGPGMGLGASIKVSDFGSTGSGAVVSFAPESGFTPSAVSSTDTSGNLSTSGFTADSDRLAAGPYQSTVTLVLQPGV